MSEFGFIAGVTGVFFLFGIAFGVLAVIAASALGGAGRARRKRARSEGSDTDASTGWTGVGWGDGWTDTTSTGWVEPPGPDEGSQDNGPPRWPGGPGGR